MVTQIQFITQLLAKHHVNQLEIIVLFIILILVIGLLIKLIHINNQPIDIFKPKTATKSLKVIEYLFSTMLLILGLALMIVFFNS